MYRRALHQSNIVQHCSEIRTRWSKHCSDDAVGPETPSPEQAAKFSEYRQSFKLGSPVVPLLLFLFLASLIKTK